MDPKLQLLGQVPLFSRLDAAGLEEVGRLTDEIDVEPGRELMRQGELGHEFFFVMYGRIAITRDGARLSTLGHGDFFGEIALLDGGLRTATAVAELPSRLLVLGHQQFQTLLAEFPGIRTAVFEALAQRVRRLEPDAGH